LAERWSKLNMNEPAVPITIALRIPGEWPHPRELIQRLPAGCRLTAEALILPDTTRVAFGVMAADDQFGPIFRSSCRPPPTEEELATVENSTANVLLSGAGGSMPAARTMMQAGAAVVRAGGAGVFIDNSVWFEIYAVVAMVAGTLFLMWLGEQITDKGIGNGVSLIIFIGIVLRYPQYVAQTYTSTTKGGESIANLIIYIVIAILVIVSIVFLYQGQRRIPVQQARRVVGRKMFAGRSTYIPLRLNNAGVISIIFAISLLLLPQQALQWFAPRGAAPHNFLGGVATWVQLNFNVNGPLYNLVYFILVVVFTFFYSAVVLNTKDIADNLTKSGSFIPGIRPGQPTVDYINRILIRITTAAAIYLGLLAVLPGMLQRGLSVTTFYLGSTSLLIVVGVALDTITQIEARLAMRAYRGFIKK